MIKNTENSTMYNMQELHLFSFSLNIFTSSSIFSSHSSTDLSINVFLDLQFSKSKYSPISHDLSQAHAQLIGFQVYPLSDTPLSINSLHSHQHLSLFHLCLLLQTIASNVQYTLTCFMPFYMPCFISSRH